MTPIADLWKMLAGVAFFLLAMELMEQSLRLLAGRRFKLFLKKQTTGKLKAISAGALVTGLLQSSSVVNLLVLSMVGAGVVKMENALALMLGSNLGTTLNSWIVATIGFDFSIETLALPLAGISGIVMAFLNKESRWFLWFKFFFSIAFLFVALEFIKTGMEGYVQQTDLAFFARYPLFVFLLLGILLTAIVQSSSATMVLTLSALHTNAISLTVATAIVLGAEIGTTLKLFLAASKGLAAKKRVALGNFLFNVITVVVMFIFLVPVNHLITDVLRIKDSLLALVFFQTFTNLVCILLFFPFLQLFGKFLLKRFASSQDQSFFISKVSPADTDLALEAIENETRHFINLVINYSFVSFDLADNLENGNDIKDDFRHKSNTEKYDYIKQLHGEVHGFYLKLQNTTTDKAGTERLDQLISAIRNSMYAAKSIRDSQYDIEQMRNSSNEFKFNFYTRSRKKLQHLYESVIQLLSHKGNGNNLEMLTAIYRSITLGYTESLQLLYKQGLSQHVSEVEISTLINLNRELYTSFKSILFGLKDYLLTPDQAAYFDAQPGFIR